MGTGKTTTGKRVAGRLGWRFIDADEEIVRRARMPISRIFAVHGEAHFRELERDICRALARLNRVVIATGGGMLIDESNRETMLRAGLVVCLTATPDALAARLSADDGRPLLKTDWKALFEQRRPIYDSFPHQVNTTSRTPDEAAAEIVRLWQSLKESA